MEPINPKRRLLPARLAAAVLWVACTAAMAGACTKPPTTIYLVRHADKSTTPPDDPALTPQGEQRALALGDALKEAAVAAIIVSDLVRTQQTAQPLAAQLGLTPIVIPLKTSTAAQYVQAVVAELTGPWAGRRVLVVSHNTLLQQIAAQLGASPLGAIDEQKGYDHLFIIEKPRESGSVKLSRARYGACSQCPE